MYIDTLVCSPSSWRMMRRLLTRGGLEDLRIRASSVRIHQMDED